MTPRPPRNQSHCPVPAMCDECHRNMPVRIFADPRNAHDVMVLCAKCDTAFHASIAQVAS